MRARSSLIPYWSSAPDMFEALEPFAKAAEAFSPLLPDETVVDLTINGHQPTYSFALGSLRAALAAYRHAGGDLAISSADEVEEILF